MPLPALFWSKRQPFRLSPSYACKEVALKKAILTTLFFLVICACVFGVGRLAEPATAIKALEATSPCPAVGCMASTCHGPDAIPEPDGASEMICPETGCASAQCHAWDTLRGHYRHASDASLNLWILAPVFLVVTLVLSVKGLSGKKRIEREAQGDDTSLGGSVGC